MEWRITKVILAVIPVIMIVGLFLPSLSGKIVFDRVIFIHNDILFPKKENDGFSHIRFVYSMNTKKSGEINSVLRAKIDLPEANEAISNFIVTTDNFIEFKFCINVKTFYAIEQIPKGMKPSSPKVVTEGFNISNKNSKQIFTQIFNEITLNKHLVSSIPSNFDFVAVFDERNHLSIESKKGCHKLSREEIQNLKESKEMRIGPYLLSNNDKNYLISNKIATKYGDFDNQYQTLGISIIDLTIEPTRDSKPLIFIIYYGSIIAWWSFIILGKQIYDFVFS